MEYLHSSQHWFHLFAFLYKVVDPTISHSFALKLSRILAVTLFIHQPTTTFTAGIETCTESVHNHVSCLVTLETSILTRAKIFFGHIHTRLTPK